MPRKASFDSLSARVVGFALDFTTKDNDFNTYGYYPGTLSKYALITTEDPHNFTAGNNVTINGLYATMVPTPYTQTLLALTDIPIVKVVGENSFVIKCPASINDGYFDTNPSTAPGATGFYYTAYPGSPLSIGTGDFVNPFCTTSQKNGNLGAYHIIYGRP